MGTWVQEPISLVIGKAGRGEDPWLVLAKVKLGILVHHQHDLRTLLGFEALPGTHRFKPVNQVFERLERIVRGNGVEDRPCPLHLGHGMIGLASPEQLHHAPLVSSPSGRRIGSGLLVSRCWRVDSNHRPTDYESVALPAELRQPASRARKGERALYQRQN